MSNKYFTKFDCFSYEYVMFVNEVIDDAFENVFMFRGGSLDLFAFLTGEGQ